MRAALAYAWRQQPLDAKNTTVDWHNIWMSQPYPISSGHVYFKLKTLLMFCRKLLQDLQHDRSSGQGLLSKQIQRYRTHLFLQHRSSQSRIFQNLKFSRSKIWCFYILFSISTHSVTETSDLFFQLPELHSDCKYHNREPGSSLQDLSSLGFLPPGGLWQTKSS